MTIPIIVHAGASIQSLQPMDVNGDATPLFIASDSFVGRATVRLQPYYKAARSEPETGYFAKREGGMSWSIAVEGRFLGDYSADDIMFGNTWEKPIRDSLPYGTSAGLRSVKLIDPSLEHDLYADKPHAESPLIATMNYVSTSKLSAASTTAQSSLPEPNVDEQLPSWNSDPILDDVSSLFGGSASSQHEGDSLKGNASARKRYFSDQKRRQAIRITGNDVISCDFCNGYIDFSTLSLKLPIGLSISLKEHWDGQPITFICQTRDRSKIFFVITFQIGDEKDNAEDLKDVSDTRSDHSTKKIVSADQDDLGVD